MKVICEDFAINAAATHYLDLAQQEGIKVPAQISQPRQLKIDGMEFSVALSNGLENALEA